MGWSFRDVCHLCFLVGTLHCWGVAASPGPGKGCVWGQHHADFVVAVTDF